MAKKRDGENLRMALSASLGFTKGAARQVAPNERGLPAVKQRLDRLQYLVACDQAIAKRDKELTAGMADVKARYWAFMKETTALSRDMRTVIPVTDGDTVRFVTTADEVKQKSDTLARGPRALHRQIQGDPERSALRPLRRPQPGEMVRGGGETHLHHRDLGAERGHTADQDRRALHQ